MSPSTQVRVRELPTCPICHGAGKVLHEGVKDGFGLAEGSWRFRRCTAASCRHIWLDPAPLAEDLPKVYERYPVHEHALPRERPTPSWSGRAYHALLKGMGVDRRRRRLDRFFLTKGKPVRVLEVGCGAGSRLEGLKAIGHDVTGQDFVPAAADAAAKRGIHVHVGDLATVGLAHESFDVIALHHVLEHVPDPVATLRACYALLRPGGRLVSIHPNGDSRLHRRFGKDWVGLDAPRHLHAFSPASSRSAARQAGFGKASVATTTLRHGLWVRMSSDWAARNAGQPRPTMARLNRLDAQGQLGALLAHPLRPGQGDEIVLRSRRDP